MEKKFMNAMLIHIGTNLWYEVGNTKAPGPKVWQSPASESMRFDLTLFRELTETAAKKGVDTLVLDLADGIVYESHPELAIEGSLTRDVVKSEIERLSALGFEIIPKVNLSACHDTWLKEYSKMVSTKIYYDVCRDVLHEVCDIFRPRYVHIGFDEENYENQAGYDYVTVRQNELWWADLKFFAECVEECGARACIWADYARHKPEEFVEKCPRSIVACPWYYGNEFDLQSISEFGRIRLTPYKILAEAGFDILGGASNEYHNESFEMQKRYLKDNIPKDQLIGLIQTTWAATTEEYRGFLFEAIDLIERANGI